MSTPKRYLTIRNVPDRYTPSQAAQFTGVSTELQRDWRRRGILKSRAGEGHTRFEFEDLCRMVALKAFSDAGVRLKAANNNDLRDATMAANVALMPMLAYGGVEVRTTESDHRIGRFVIVDGQGVCRVDNLADYERGRTEKRSADPVTVIFDCKVAAEGLLSKLDRPPYVREEIEHDGELQ